MVENIYSFLAATGFNHPLHPMLTHVPMGMVIGMVTFSFLGLFWRAGSLDKTAHHCAILALVSIAPVIGAGFLDWIHFQEADLNNFIIAKMILGALITILLFMAVIMKKRGAGPGKMFLIYLLCLACAGGLGYSGGSLVYG